MMSNINRATETFDYVIVGAGAAGSILANRLSEDGKSTVCVLEAGPSDWHPFLHIPAGFIKVLFDPAFTWQFSSEPTDNTKGRRIPIPQGRTLGGSTAINGLAYNRGQPRDFDAWAAAGNKGWGYADVLPYFKRSERKVGRGDDTYHDPGIAAIDAIKHPNVNGIEAVADAVLSDRSDGWPGLLADWGHDRVKGDIR